MARYASSVASTLFALFVALGLGSFALGDVYVRGYYRKDGTYVRPHHRSDPDGNFWNNWSTKGNVNPYTGKPGTKTSPSPNYGQDVPVSGYYRANGTYVAPHYRSAPDGDPYNNWSTRGNVNPYTGTPGTRTVSPPVVGLRAVPVSLAPPPPAPVARVFHPDTRRGSLPYVPAPAAKIVPQGGQEDVIEQAHALLAHLERERDTAKPKASLGGANSWQQGAGFACLMIVGLIFMAYDRIYPSPRRK
jgi:hypothetical protein